MTRQMIIGVVAGLMLFLMGLSMLGESLTPLATDRARDVLARATRGRLLAFVTEFVATVVLDSSSAVCILVVGLVNARMMTLRQALPVILGANVGTTVGGQVFAFNLEAWAPALMLVGLVLRLSSNATAQRLGPLLGALGVLFFGLEHIGHTLEPLKSDPDAVRALSQLSVPWKGVLAGTLLTLVIQSSSATVGMAIKLLGDGVLSFPAGVAIMLGADIGTTSDVFVAGAYRAGAAFKAALFQVIFNVVTVALGVLLMEPLSSTALWLTPQNPARALANAHLIFNLVGAALFLPFTNRVAAFLDKDGGKGVGASAIPTPSPG
jgi:phosphate:Na+ symporter